MCVYVLLVTEPRSHACQTSVPSLDYIIRGLLQGIHRIKAWELGVRIPGLLRDGHPSSRWPLCSFFLLSSCFCPLPRGPAHYYSLVWSHPWPPNLYHGSVSLQSGCPWAGIQSCKSSQLWVRTRNKQALETVAKSLQSFSPKMIIGRVVAPYTNSPKTPWILESMFTSPGLT